MFLKGKEQRPPPDGRAKAFAETGARLSVLVAVAVPVMIASATAHARGKGVSWGEAMKLGRALEEGFRLVRRLGNTLTPAPVAAVSRLPIPLAASLLWTASRLSALRKAGAAGYGEPRALIDAMSAAAPGETPALLAVRP